MIRQPDFNAQVLVLSPEGTQLGKMTYRDAQNLALTNYDLDIVQVGKNQELPVCKIMDYGKWKYNQRKNKKKAHSHQVKEMAFKVRIEEHDLQVKVNKIRGFLSKGDDVKISVLMKGREKSHPQLAHEKLNDILSALSDIAQVQPIKSTPSSIITIVHSSRSSNSHGKNIPNQAASGNHSTV